VHQLGADFCMPPSPLLCVFNDPDPPGTSTLSLHDALPISCPAAVSTSGTATIGPGPPVAEVTSRATASATDGRDSSMNPPSTAGDRKSTRLNSSHQIISYAVFCLKKKTQKWRPNHDQICNV